MVNRENWILATPLAYFSVVVFINSYRYTVESIWIGVLEYYIARNQNMIMYYSTKFLSHNSNMRPDRKDLLAKDKKAKRPKAPCMKNILQTLHYQIAYPKFI